MVLAKKWDMSPKKAHNTICCIMQHGVCTVLHPSLSRQFRSNDCKLQNRRLLHDVDFDTWFATAVSRRGNRCTQIFVTDFGWSCPFPMKLKSEVHEALLFWQDRVPLAMTCDNANKMILGEFNRKLNEMPCHLRKTEPFTSWLNATEREIKELKKGSGRKLMKSGATKRLCDDYLEFESCVRFNTAHGMYKLDGEVLEIIMSRETSDIASFVSLSGLNG